jgi:hypothetical protein
MIPPIPAGALDVGEWDLRGKARNFTGTQRGTPFGSDMVTVENPRDSGVLGNLALAPAALLGAFLNGYLDGPSTDIVAGGLFDPSEGLVADIESTLQSIASTITPASSSVAMAVDPLAGVTSDFSAMLGSGGLGDLSTLFADLGALPAAVGAVPADLASLPTDLLSMF